jgi:CheY-like chemotaxis protein
MGIMLTNERPAPLIIAFIADLMFGVKVEDAAKRLNFRVEWVERASVMASEDTHIPQRQFGEHMLGAGAVLLEMLTRKQPALIIMDLNNDEIPWREWLSLIKSVPATRRIPLICYGSHVDAAGLRDAKEAGADVVLARSQFSAGLPEIIQKYAHIPDYEGIAHACEGSLPALARRGLEEFNRGEYFEAHESLEAAWNQDESPAREAYRAILQVAVAYLQIERGNYNGAVKMFLRMRQWFEPLPDRCRGVNIAQLRMDAQRVADTLYALGAERVGEFDRVLLRPVLYDQD